MANITATTGSDNLIGTDAADSISGLAGDDTIRAGSGSDTILGGDGNEADFFTAFGDYRSGCDAAVERAGFGNQ